MDKYLNIVDDLEQCQKEAGLFLDQADEDILIPDRPPRQTEYLLAGSKSQEVGKSYILNRFITDTRMSSPSRAKYTKNTTIRSMQHFFLKVSSPEGFSSHLP